MSTATATELELLVIAPVSMEDGMGGDDAVAADPDADDAEEPGDDDLKEAEGEDGEPDAV